jgi:lysine 6-dehydrogenase
MDTAFLGSQRGDKQMSYRYAVLGAGRQGVAAAYDMAKFGDAREIVLVDSDIEIAEDAARRVNELVGSPAAVALRVDVAGTAGLTSALEGVDSLLSAVPYTLNPGITQVAIASGTSMCDLGGNTDIVRKQLSFDAEARSAGVSIIPDCGMGPGMNISLALHAMSLVEKPREVYIWDGGLPQEPKEPWNFELSFDVRGLTNEYSGNAYFLRNGKVVEVPCFDGYERVEFSPPLGVLEAFVTSGGLSTAPWTFEGKLERLENRTLRYPGHWAQFKAYAQLGLMQLGPVQVGRSSVVPREFFHALLETRVGESEVRDVGVMRVKCVGENGGKHIEAIVELIDYYDAETGFTAMQRLTGWHASIVAILAARGEVPRGAVPIELAVPGTKIVEEARRRGFCVSETATEAD